MNIPQTYVSLRHNLKFDSISLGFTTVFIFKEEEINKAQIGYNIDMFGNSLIEENNGDWKENWIVIGYEDCCGDPIIIDTYDLSYPVYTSIHGESCWELILISDTFDKFIKNLELIKEISKDRENPVKLDKNPITEIEKRKFIESVYSNNPNSDLSFWEAWMD